MYHTPIIIIIIIIIDNFCLHKLPNYMNNEATRLAYSLNVINSCFRVTESMQ
jgi:hypothetical protein